jgi:hypothetical protein
MLRLAITVQNAIRLGDPETDCLRVGIVATPFTKRTGIAGSQQSNVFVVSLTVLSYYQTSRRKCL